MHFLAAQLLPAARYSAAQSAAMRRFKGLPASVVFLLVPPSESRSPPALITVRIERASHRSSSSELLIFSPISRALGSISRGQNDASLPAKLPAGYRILRIPSTKMNPSIRLTPTVSRNSDCIIEPTITESDKIARWNTVKTPSARNKEEEERKKNTFASAVTHNGPLPVAVIWTRYRDFLPLFSRHDVKCNLPIMQMSNPSNPGESRGISSPNGMQVGSRVQKRARLSPFSDEIRSSIYYGSTHLYVVTRATFIRAAYTVQWPCAALRWTALGATERTAVYRVVYSVRTRLHSRRRGTLSVSRPRETAKINERFAENDGVSRLSDSLSVAILRPEPDRRARRVPIMALGEAQIFDGAGGR